MIHLVALTLRDLVVCHSAPISLSLCLSVSLSLCLFVSLSLFHHGTAQGTPRRAMSKSPTRQRPGSTSGPSASPARRSVSPTLRRTVTVARAAAAFSGRAASPPKAPFIQSRPASSRPSTGDGVITLSKAGLRAIDAAARAQAQTSHESFSSAMGNADVLLAKLKNPQYSGPFGGPEMRQLETAVDTLLETASTTPTVHSNMTGRSVPKSNGSRKPNSTFGPAPPKTGRRLPWDSPGGSGAVVERRRCVVVLR